MVVVVVVSRWSQEIEYNGPPPQQRVRLSQGLDRFPFSCLNNSNQATFHSSADFAPHETGKATEFPKYVQIAKEHSSATLDPVNFCSCSWKSLQPHNKL